jgi:hypothetical protein
LLEADFGFFKLQADPPLQLFHAGSYAAGRAIARSG